MPSEDSTWELYQRAFLDDLRAQNLSGETLASYGSALKLFRDHLLRQERTVGPSMVTPDDVRGFITALLENWKAATAHNRYRGLNRFFNWLVEQEYLQRSPMAKLKPPRLEDKVVAVITADDLRRLFKSLTAKDFESRRDRAIVSILCDTGLRLSEIADLRWLPDDPAMNDVDLDYGQLRVMGKGRRERIVSIGKAARGDLSRYLIARSQHRHADLPHLWLARKGRLSGSGIYQAIKERGRAIGVTLNPHQFRHTFAHEWLASGGNETDLMRLTGWNSRTMLQRYGASAGASRALAAHKRLSPRDRI